MRKVLLTLLAAGLAAAGLATSHIVTASNGVPPGHIGICHHTGQSQAHEWIFITPSADGVLDGHGKPSHNFNEDIIPAFVLVTPQGTVTYPGHNLDERIGVDLEPDPNGPYTGAQILAAGCATPVTTTTTTPPQTTTVTTPGSTTTITLPGSTTTITLPGQTVTTTITIPPKPVVCTSLVVRPRQFFVGRPTRLIIVVKRHAKAVRGIRVLIHGAGLNLITKRSNPVGVISRSVTLGRPGVVRFRPLVAHSCGVKKVGVTGVFTPPVTG